MIEEKRSDVGVWVKKTNGNRVKAWHRAERAETRGPLRAWAARRAKEDDVLGRACAAWLRRKGLA